MQSSPPISLAAIEGRVRRLARKIEVPRGYLPSFGRSLHDGTPHIEVADRYDFVVCERGEEYERRGTADLDELLYWIFASVTFSMACDHEVRHRRSGEDSRRLLFARQVELLAGLSAAWAGREAAEHRRILEEHPFVDG